MTSMTGYFCTNKTNNLPSNLWKLCLKFCLIGLRYEECIQSVFKNEFFQAEGEKLWPLPAWVQVEIDCYLVSVRLTMRSMH